ncbi:hypothetical protein F4827_001763 [Paraburkholderia bannensis]|uniref:Uncharacterized protein n=1 Tax=Paraburkholderia bannensis TaxID=765414 RepID=A0A7W9TWZ8_9BURK|nr:MULTISPECIES: hypothetical protein [Paraburkholderia]MBB3256961.1 hypothetical protein [Paraburkholderia sp. WP4_3_2]MBB6101915.1 hypothetical protein [Paraburkholderia bannensis]
MACDLMVCSVELSPAAFFAPVVFAIAIPPLAGNWTPFGITRRNGLRVIRVLPARKKQKQQKQTAENLRV